MPWKSPSRPRSSLVVPVATAGFDGRLPAKGGRSSLLQGCRFTPRLLDYLVRTQQQFLRNRKPESPRGLEIDHQIEFRGLLNGKIARFCAAKDAVDVFGV
jgi:hypothetical protein